MNGPVAQPPPMSVAGIAGLPRLLESMEPKLHPGSWCFCTVPTDSELYRSIPRAEVLMEFKETEGTTLIISLADAKKHVDAGRELTWEYEAAWLTLTVHSSLQAVGLTAAFSTALATDGISANVVAGFYHDHIFVAAPDGERAVACLKRLSEQKTTGGGGIDDSELGTGFAHSSLAFKGRPPQPSAYIDNPNADQSMIAASLERIEAKLSSIDARLPTSNHSSIEKFIDPRDSAGRTIGTKASLFRSKSDQGFNNTISAWAAAVMIQCLCRGHQQRGRFHQAWMAKTHALLDQGPSTDGDNGTSYLDLLSNERARRFWAANIGARSTSICEVLDALDAWLDAGGIDSHDRPQVLMRLRECFSRAGDVVTFGHFNRLTAPIVPFSPAKSVGCKRTLPYQLQRLMIGLSTTVLASTFVQHHALTAHVADSGWTKQSYLDMIENYGARQFWEQCVGEKKVYARSVLSALEAWLHREMHRLSEIGTDPGQTISETHIRQIISVCERALLNPEYKFLSWSDWNRFSADLVPFTPAKFLDVVSNPDWPCKSNRSSQGCTGDEEYVAESAYTEPEHEPVGELALSSEEPAPLMDQLRNYEINFAIDYDQLELKSVIGSGTYGKVYKAIWKAGHIWCAVKRLFAVPIDLDQRMNDFYREVSLQRDLHHPNVISCYGAYNSPSRNSRHQVDQVSGIKSDFVDFIMCMGVAAGMAYLHSRSIVHRDLKADNVLIDNFKQVKICDFGISAITKKGKQLDELVGTPQLMAPEVCLGQPYDFKADVYSFGVLMWEMATLEVPWKGVNPITVRELVGVNDQRPQWPEGKAFDEAFRSLVDCSWRRSPNERPTFNDVYDRLKTIGAITSVQ